jgi:hypothetical protein
VTVSIVDVLYFLLVLTVADADAIRGFAQQFASYILFASFSHLYFEAWQTVVRCIGVV